MSRYSDYWLDSHLFGDDEDDDLLIDTLDDEEDDTENSTVHLERITRLAAVRRAISNFVAILSGQNVPVQFSSGGQSYTDGKSVVIAADTNPKNFDVMVGLALHEGSHVLLSDFSFLEACKGVSDNMRVYSIPNKWCGHYIKQLSFGIKGGADPITQNILHPELYAILPTPPDPDADWEAYSNSPYWEATRKMFGHLHNISNILEDRRIDKYVYTNAMGYRPYYDALYKKYFYTAEIGKNLKFNPEWREITVENYITRTLLMFHPDASVDAMPGLDTIYKLVDLDNIDRVSRDNDATVATTNPDGTPGTEYKWMTCVSYNNMPTLWKASNEILLRALKYASFARSKMKELPGPPNQSGDSLEDMLGDNLFDADFLPNLDMDMSPTECEVGRGGVPGKFNGERGNKKIQDLLNSMKDGFKKKRINRADKDAVSAMEQAQASLVDISGDGIPFGNCMVIRKITDDVLNQPWFIFSKRYFSPSVEGAVAAGRRMGAILAHRLQVRNDPLFTTQTRLPQGKIDRRMLAQLGMDIESVFYKSRVDMHKPAMLHLTLDASSSMIGDKWGKVVTVATALAYVSTKIKNIDVVISIRGGDNIPVVAVLFDSRKDQFINYTRIIQKVGPSGCTPESLCFKATMDLILECANTHVVYFINFSDGEPVFTYEGKDKTGARAWFSYGGDVAVTHTRAMMRKLRENGVKILSYFISHGNNSWSDYSKDVFKQLYGEDAAFVSVTNAAEVVRTLNRRLIDRETG